MKHTLSRIVAGAFGSILLPFASPSTVAAPAVAETVTIQFAQPMPNLPGKTFTTAVVTFPPGSRAVPHRHGLAFVYAYVLEGAVRSQLDDEPVKTYRLGQDWAERPGAHHVLTENESRTAPARLLVVFVADTGAQLKAADSEERAKP